MTGSAPVRVRERMFWCRPDALAVWVAHVVEEIRARREAPDWLQTLGQDWGIAAGFPDFGLHWDPDDDESLAVVTRLCQHACARARAAGDLTAERLRSWHILDGISVADGTGGRPVEADRVLEVAGAFSALLDGTLPPDPPGAAWFFGTGEGPQTTDR